MPGEGEERVRCPSHGDTTPTFACVHLATRGSSGLGVCYDPGCQTPWPDIICNACSAEPAWTDEQTLRRVKVLCTYCWEDVFASNTQTRHADPEGWMHDALHRAKRRHDRWVEDYGITGFAHYRYGLEDEPPWLGFGPANDRFTVLCDVAVIGTWSSRSRTWLWSWANDWCPPAQSRVFLRVKRAAERIAIEPLWRSHFESDEGTAWTIAAAALDGLPEFQGIYRAPYDGGSLFLAARNTRRVA